MIYEILKNNQKYIDPIDENILTDIKNSENLENDTIEIIKKIYEYIDKKELKKKNINKLHNIVQQLDEVLTNSFCRGENCEKPVETNETFDDVVGMTREKVEVTTQFIQPLFYPKLFPESKSNILLYGPPGTGKTFLVKAIVNQLPNYVLFSPSPSKLKDKYVGGTEKQIQNIFDCACEYLRINNNIKGVILFLDEMENVATDRRFDEDAKRSVPTLLQAWDGIKSIPNISIIGATNYPDNLDGAVIRRFNTKIFVDLPHRNARKEIIKKRFVKHYKHLDFTYEDLLSYDIIQEEMIDDITDRTGAHVNSKDNIKHRLKGKKKENSYFGREQDEEEISAKAESKYGFSSSDLNNLVERIIRNSASRALEKNIFYKLTDVYEIKQQKKYFISRKDNINNIMAYFDPIYPNPATTNDLIELQQKEKKNIISFEINIQDINESFSQYKSSINNEDYEIMIKYYTEN